jgi:histidyl-tRNA synthetase
LGAQGTVCAGGRYDGLVEQWGGRGSSAIGFALGIERLIDLLGERADVQHAAQPHAYLIRVGDEAECRGAQLAEDLRSELPDLRLVLHCGGGSFKSQFKRADKSGADYALILGHDEARDGTVGIKALRHDGAQETVDQSDLAAYLQSRIPYLGGN